MTVKQLRELIADMPDDAVVDVDDDPDGLYDEDLLDDDACRFWDIKGHIKKPDRLTLVCDITAEVDDYDAVNSDDD